MPLIVSLKQLAQLQNTTFWQREAIARTIRVAMLGRTGVILYTAAGCVLGYGSAKLLHAFVMVPWVTVAFGVFVGLLVYALDQRLCTWYATTRRPDLLHAPLKGWSIGTAHTAVSQCISDRSN